VWQADGLRPTAIGAYTLAVPVALLPEGRYRLTLTPHGGKAIDYAVRVRRAR
jgi:hypothetical protein